MKKILIPFLASLLIVAGCETKVNIERPVSTGSFSLSVTCNEDGYTDKPLLKSEMTASVSTDLFTVSITKLYDEYGQPAVWSNTWTLAEFPTVLEMSPGQYKIAVKSPVADRTSTLAPIFSAEKNFTIVENKVTDLELVCTVQNMKVTVAPTANFFTELRNFTISVTAEYEGIDTPVSVSWKDADFVRNADGTYSTSKEAYFEAVPLSVMVTGVRTLDGTDASLKEPYKVTDVASRDNHILNIDVQVTGETKMAFITVDPSLNAPKDTDVFVPGFEEIPIPDEEEEEESGSDSKETSLEWQANPEFGPVSLKVNGADITVDPLVKVVVKCPRRISSFIIKVSDNFKGVISALTTGNVDYLDLVSDQALIDFFVGDMYLPTGSELAGKTNVDFDLSSLAAMVPLIASADKEETVFTLEVVDSTGKTFTKDIVFITSNPDASAE